jgi:4-amino-4-deoxy-L-arabinose transferase-like glycosyltransferase
MVARGRRAAGTGRLSATPPAVTSPSCVPRRRHELLVLLLLLLCYGWFIPRAGRSDWNATARADLVFAVADHGVLRIDDYHQNTGDKAYFEGHYYAVGSIGPSLLALPAYLALEPVLALPPVARRLARAEQRPAAPLAAGAHRDATPRERLAMLVMTLFAVALPSAVMGVVVYRLACRVVPRERDALVAALTYGLATVAFPYSKALFQHQVSAFGAFVGFYLLWRVAREGAAPWRLWVVGVLFSLATISEYPVAPFLLLLLVWAWREMPRPWDLHRVVGGALPLGLLFAAYNWVIFHTPFPAGYRYHVEYHDVHGQGFMGFTGPTWAAFFGITVSPYRGLFFLSPVLLLCLPGLVSLARDPRFRSTAVLVAVLLAGFLLYVASYLYWSGGDAVGPRFLVPLVPFLMLPVARAWSEWSSHRVGRVGLWTLLVVSALNVWAQSVAGQHYPPDEFRGTVVTNPTTQWALPLLREGDVADNFGYRLGLTGLATLLPLAVAAATVMLLLNRRRPEY